MTLRLGLEATEVYNLAASQFSRRALSVQSEQRETTERLLWSHSKTRSVYHGVTARRGASLLRLRLPSLPRIFGCCGSSQGGYRRAAPVPRSESVNKVTPRLAKKSSEVATRRCTKLIIASPS